MRTYKTGHQVMASLVLGVYIVVEDEGKQIITLFH